MHRTAEKRARCLHTFCEATSRGAVPQPETLNPALMSTHRAPRSNADSKLLPDEGVVDPVGDVVEGFSVIRANERGKKVFLLYVFDFYTKWDRCAAHVITLFPVKYQTLAHLR